MIQIHKLLEELAWMLIALGPFLLVIAVTMPMFKPSIRVRIDKRKEKWRKHS